MLLSRRNNLFDEFFNDPFFNDSVQNRTTLMRTDIEDDGTNYDYEKGLYSNIRFIWNDARNELTITRREGKFPGMNTTRNIRIIKISNALNGNTNKEKTIIYNGQKVSVKL